MDQHNFLPIDFLLKAKGCLKDATDVVNDTPKRAPSTLKTTSNPAQTKHKLRRFDYSLGPKKEIAEKPVKLIDPNMKTSTISAKTVKKVLTTKLTNDIQAEIRKSTRALSGHRKISQFNFETMLTKVQTETQQRKVKVKQWTGALDLTDANRETLTNERENHAALLLETQWKIRYYKYASVENSAFPVYHKGVKSIVFTGKEPADNQLLKATKLKTRFKKACQKIIEKCRLQKRLKLIQQGIKNANTDIRPQKIVKSEFFNAFNGDLAQVNIDFLSSENTVSNDAIYVESDAMIRPYELNFDVGKIVLEEEMSPMSLLPCDFINLHGYVQYEEFSKFEMFLGTKIPEPNKKGTNSEDGSIGEFVSDLKALMKADSNTESFSIHTALSKGSVVAQLPKGHQQRPFHKYPIFALGASNEIDGDSYVTRIRAKTSKINDPLSFDGLTNVKLHFQEFSDTARGNHVFRLFPMLQLTEAAQREYKQPFSGAIASCFSQNLDQVAKMSIFGEDDYSRLIHLPKDKLDRLKEQILSAKKLNTLSVYWFRKVNNSFAESLKLMSTKTPTLEFKDEQKKNSFSSLFRLKDKPISAVLWTFE